MPNNFGGDQYDEEYKPSKPKKLTKARKQALQCAALAYCGDLIKNIMDTTTNFDHLTQAEHDFITEYVISLGERLIAQAESRVNAAENKIATTRIMRKLDR